MAESEKYAAPNDLKINNCVPFCDSLAESLLHMY